jgi:hypothetical protein
MHVHRGPRMDATILGAASLLALAMGGASAASSDQFVAAAPPAVVSEGVVSADLVGAWLGTDGAVKLELAANGTYKRSLKGHEKVARGTYRIVGLSLQLRDKAGLSTTVKIFEGALELAGHRLHRAP